MKSSQWVSSAFEDYDDFGKSSPLKKKSTKSEFSKARGKKRLRDEYSGGAKFEVKRRNNVSNTDLWVDKYTPMQQDELAVHKKKITEVEMWLLSKSQMPTSKCPILLLTGPGGCGKTSTLKLIAAQLKMDIQEWSNPLTDSFVPKEQNDFFSGGFSFKTESQKTLFQDFILRANKYPCLHMTGKSQLNSKLILVEEFPNIFFKESDIFHDIVRKYAKLGNCPLVFIISDSAAGESNERLLFPKDMQADLGINNISFNAVASTILSKTLLRIASNEASEGAHKFPVPSKETIDALCAGSNGDIRGAINALQFACLKDTGDLSLVLHSDVKTSGKTKKARIPASKKSKKSKIENGFSAIGGKDSSLFLFRALGKVLYCKRSNPEELPVTEFSSLPTHLSHHYRDPLLIVPEDVVERSHMSAELFNAYLHENYIEFFSEIDDIVQASAYFSDTDYLTVDWTSRTIMKEYSSCVACRGVMHSNSSRSHYNSSSNTLGFKPLHKPQWFTSMKKMRENLYTAKSLFKGHFWTPDDLTTQILPYLLETNCRLANQAQTSFLNQIGRFGKLNQRTNPERLDENDVGNLHICDDELPRILTEGTTADGQDQLNMYDDDNVVIDDSD